MNTMLKLTTPFVLAGVSASIAFAQTAVTPEVLFQDGFESNNFSNWPFSATASTTISSVVYTGTVTPLIVTSGGAEQVFRGQYAVKIPGRNSALPSIDPANLPRVSLGALLSRPITNDEVAVFTFYMFDHFGLTGYASTGTNSFFNTRLITELRDTDGTSPYSNVAQIAAFGLWNQTNATFGVGTFADTNMWFGAAPAGQSLANHYSTRLISVATGAGLLSGQPTPTAGSSAPQQTYLGVGPNFRRVGGWRRMTVAYGVRRVEFLVDNRVYGSWNINPNALNPTRQVDSLILNRTENPALDSWVDEYRVRAFPTGSLNLKVEVIGASTEDLSALPLTLELVPTNGNTNAALGPITVNTNSAGEINLALPSLYRGSYDLFINGTPWLRRKIAINMTDFGSYDNLIRLPGGDVDDSTEVDLTDIDIIIGNYLTGTTPAQGDLDLNGEVDLTDIDIAISSYLLADD